MHICTTWHTRPHLNLYIVYIKPCPYLQTQLIKSITFKINSILCRIQLMQTSAKSLRELGFLFFFRSRTRSHIIGVHVACKQISIDKNLHLSSLEFLFFKYGHEIYLASEIWIFFSKVMESGLCLNNLCHFNKYKGLS